MYMILNKTRKHRDRYILVNGPQGNYGYPPNHANHKFHVANGIDKGNGFQGYLSVSYALDKDSYVPEEAKNRLRQILTKLGYKSETME